MNRQQAVWLVYCMGEAVNQPEMRKLLERMYGTKGLEGAVEGCRALAQEFAFEMPVIEQ